LVITHRMSHIADADLILLMEEGRLVDQGAHGDLLTRSPLYRSLCAEGDERAAADPASADSAPESARA
jgi:ATP-binding cassette subfamily B protein